VRADENMSCDDGNGSGGDGGCSNQEIGQEHGDEGGDDTDAAGATTGGAGTSAGRTHKRRCPNPSQDTKDQRLGRTLRDLVKAADSYIEDETAANGCSDTHKPLAVMVITRANPRMRSEVLLQGTLPGSNVLAPVENSRHASKWRNLRSGSLQHLELEGALTSLVENYAYEGAGESGGNAGGAAGANVAHTAAAAGGAALLPPGLVGTGGGGILARLPGTGADVMERANDFLRKDRDAAVKRAEVLAELLAKHGIPIPPLHPD
jgi:hypothetical protein